MRETTISQIEKATSGLLVSGAGDDTVTGVSTDSRKAGKSDVFFALTGENHDAHEFIPDAVKNGARSVVISREGIHVPAPGLNVIKVGDTMKALHDFAKWYIADLGIKVVGITGSTGKTTTKDLLYYICREKYITGRTTGNLNTHVGLPLTVFSFGGDVEVGILEMGAEVIGEIHLLADIARPDISIITNIGVSHIESFGSRDNIFKGKMEIKDFFSDRSLLIVNGDNDMLARENVSGAYRLATVGGSGKNDYILSDISELGEDGIEFTLDHETVSKRFKLSLPGRHNAVNASLAIAAAADLGISMDEAEKGLQKAVLTEKRLNIKGKNGIKLIDDTYNASPDSMRAAIGVLLATKGLRKVAVLSDMLGLGQNGRVYHEQIGEFIAQSNIDLLVLTGELSKHVAEKARLAMGDEKVVYFGSRKKLIEEIKDIVTSGDVVLVKGSRATAMEDVAKKILE